MQPPSASEQADSFLASMGNPLATTSVTPTTLASNVSKVKMLGMFTPLRKALRSGSPDEAAEGAQ